jgi:hypothetical protein
MATVATLLETKRRQGEYDSSPDILHTPIKNANENHVTEGTNYLTPSPIILRNIFT